MVRSFFPSLPSPPFLSFLFRNPPPFNFHSSCLCTFLSISPSTPFPIPSSSLSSCTFLSFSHPSPLSISTHVPLSFLSNSPYSLPFPICPLLLVPCTFFLSFHPLLFHFFSPAQVPLSFPLIL